MTERTFQPSIIFRKDTEGFNGLVHIDDYHSTFLNSPYQHVKHYATSGFEGILAVRDSKDEWHILTLDENIDRMARTMKLLFISEPGNLEEMISVRTNSFPDIPMESAARDNAQYLSLTPEEIREAIMETLRINAKKGYLKLDSPDGLIYIRPNFFREHKSNGDGRIIPGLGVASLEHNAVLEIMVQNVPSYLSTAPKSGARVLVYNQDVHNRVVGLPQDPFSNIHRLGFSNFSRKMKLGSNYGPGGMAKNLASLLGYDEGLLLDGNFYVLEGGGENVFMLKDDTVYTPPLSQAILPGTKRHLVMEIIKALGYDLKEEPIGLPDFIGAEAAGFSGTWTGFEPLGSVSDLFSDTESNYGSHDIFSEVKGQYSGYMAGEALNPDVAKILPQKTHVEFSR